MTGCTVAVEAGPVYGRAMAARKVRVTRRAAVAGIAAALVVGCDEKKDDEEEEEDDDGESKKSKKKKKKKKKGEDDDAPLEDKKDHFDRDAYAMGRDFAFACVFALLGKQSSVSKNVSQATLRAGKLGIGAPPTPTKQNAMATMRGTAISDAIEKKHGPEIAAAYGLGMTLTDLFFGVTLESDVSRQVAAVGKLAEKAGTPKSVYDKPYAAVKRKASDATVKALNKAIDTHYDFKS
jgi:hypothetical protein